LITTNPMKNKAEGKNAFTGADGVPLPKGKIPKAVPTGKEKGGPLNFARYELGGQGEA